MNAPTKPRVLVLVDGQNLYHGVKDAFDYTFPNYDVLALSRWLAEQAGGFVCAVRFYTGFPDQQDDRFWHAFWSKKLLAISRQGVTTFSRSLRYRNRFIKLGDGVTIERRIGEEKGIDVRIALDAVRLALDNAYDVIVIVSQDQDLSEAASDIKKIAKIQGRTIRVMSAFAWRPGAYTDANSKGINGTDWIKIDRAAYDCCVDQFDYRPDPKTANG